MRPCKPAPLAALALTALLFAAGCSTVPAQDSGSASTARVSPKSSPAAAYQETGEASWYGKRYHGRTTASGTPFDMNAMTAAHKTLPFGTVVRVTNLGNGRSVEVTINDRGPFVRGRIIDLSRGAAAKLGIIEAGVAKVRVEVAG